MSQYVYLVCAGGVASIAILAAISAVLGLWTFITLRRHIHAQKNKQI